MTREDAIQVLNMVEAHGSLAIQAKDMAIQALDALDKIRSEIKRQEKWLLQAGYTAYNADIAFDAIKSVIAESEK